MVKHRQLLMRLPLILLLGGLISCATAVSGHPINKELIPKIVKGKTTRNEVISIFGQPSGTTIAGGEETLRYSYIKSGVETNPLMYVPCVGLFFMESKILSKSQTLTVTTKDNIVTNYSYSESNELGGSLGGMNYFGN